MKKLMQWFVSMMVMLSVTAAMAAENTNSAVYRQQVDKPVSEIYDSPVIIIQD